MGYKSTVYTELKFELKTDIFGMRIPLLWLPANVTQIADILVSFVFEIRNFHAKFMSKQVCLISPSLRDGQI